MKRIIAVCLCAVLVGLLSYKLIVVKEPAKAVSVTEPVRKTKVTVAAVGDIMLGRNVATRVNEDYLSPFKDVADELNIADIRFANLECVLSDSATEKIKGKDKNFCLKGPEGMVNVLKNGNFNIVSLANNHSYDYDYRGFSDTLRVLKENGIEFVGGGNNLDEARSLKIVESGGIKVGFLAYSDMSYVHFGDKNQVAAANENKSGIAPRKSIYAIEDIEKSKELCDILLVSLHWGVEYTHIPTTDDVEFAKKLIDAGADGILGHHPHNLQGVEIYNGKPIIYSMSNFLFDQNSDLNKDSGIFNITYDEGKFIKFEFVPVRIKDKQKAVLAQGEEKRKILDHMIKFSNVLGTGFTEKDGRLYIEVGENNEKDNS